MNSVGRLDFKKGFVYSLSLYDCNGKLIMHFGVFLTCVPSTLLYGMHWDRNSHAMYCIHESFGAFHIYLRFSWASGATPSHTYYCGLPFGVTHDLLPILAIL